MMETSFQSNNSLSSVYVRVTVVIPALNEEQNLPHVLPRIPAWVHEVILVDGNSTDRTVDVARELLPDVRILKQTGRGKGNALRCGFAAATGDIIVMMDADGSTDPAEIPYFVGALLAGADFVKGSRFVQGGGTADMPFYRKVGNWGFVITVRAMYGGRFSDLCYGYNAFWRRVLPLLELDGDGFEIETVMNVRALRAGLKVAEVPSFEAPRIHGSSRLRTIPDGWRVVKAIFREGIRPAAGRTRGTQVDDRAAATGQTEGQLVMIAVDMNAGAGAASAPVRVSDIPQYLLPHIDRRKPSNSSSGTTIPFAERRNRDRQVSENAVPDGYYASQTFGQDLASADAEGN